MMTMRKLTMVLGLGLSLAAGCYAGNFTQTASYPATPRAVASVQVMTARPNDASFREVGIITAQGAGFEGALARAKDQAAQHGCEAIVVLSEAVESGRNVPGSAYGMTRNDLRCSCMVRGTAVAETH
jgi:hypothetical protein